MKTSRLAKTFALTAFGAILVPAALSATALNVTSSEDDGSPGTLRYVLKFANEGDVITIPPTTIVLTTAGATALDTDGDADLDIKKSVTIQGADAASTVIDGGGVSRVFDVDPADPTSSGASLDLESVTVQNGSASTDGGGILIENQGFLKIANAIVIGNEATGAGGGLAMSNTGPTGTDAVIINTQFLNNVSGTSGGGVFLECGAQWGGSAVIKDSLFQNNKADTDGGGIDQNCGNTDIDNTQFLNNKAGQSGSGDGGGMKNDFGGLTLTKSLFSGNEAQGNGGGLSNEYEAFIDQTEFSGNSALNGGNGGGIYTDDQMYMTNSTVSGNNSENDGGGISNDESFSADGITVTGNVSDVDGDHSGEGGGGIYNNFSLALLNSVVSGNTANNATSDGNGQGGGGIYSFDFMALRNVTVADNTVVGGDGADNSGSDVDGGGGIYVNVTADPSIIANSTITGNRVLTDHDGTGDDPVGGGIYVGESIDITNTTIANNRADGSGGGIYNDTAMTLNNVTITGNVADANDGGDSGGDGGGVFNTNDNINTDDAALLLNNSIIAGNSDNSPAHEAPDCFNDFTGFQSVIHAGSPSIIQDPTGCEIEGLSSKILNVDPLLDAAGLADNGGVVQGVAPGAAGQSISLQAGSPAIDAGDDAICPDKDQRGEARPSGAHCDLGALEVSGGGSTTGGGTTTGGATGGTTGGSSSSGGCSLIQ